MRDHRASRAGIVMKPWRNEPLFNIERLRREAKRYRLETHEAPSEHQRKHLTLMAGLSETMASNEKMRAWLDRSIVQLKSGEPLHTPQP